MAKGYHVREFCEDDDFDWFNQLVWKEHESRGKRVGIYTEGLSVDKSMKLIQKAFYFAEPDTDNKGVFPIRRKGFVLEADERLNCLASVTLDSSGNGTLNHIGFASQNREELGRLIEACLSYVRENGGSKLYCMTDILPGQLYNSEFEFWMAHQFKPEPYYSQWLVFQQLAEWELTEGLNTDGVIPVPAMDLDEIIAILHEDGESFIAEAVRFELADPTPDHVFLKLCDSFNGQINGIAYYQVSRQHGMMGTNTLGIHIRPALNHQHSFAEIQRFVRCVISSMQQLNMTYAGTRMSSRNLLAMIAMCAEGFSLAPMGQVVFQRHV